MKDSTREKIAHLAEVRSEIIAKIEGYHQGLSWCTEHTDIADQVARLLFNDLLEEYPDLPPLAIVATGGYGRSELAPFSDIDVTVVPQDKGTPLTDKAVRTLFRDLHDAFGSIMHMEVGYSYLLISDIPGLDAVTRSGLLDARLVVGFPALFRRMMQTLYEKFPVGEFLLAKIGEREEAFRKTNATPLVVEPDLKEGAGGLRCRHCANWLRVAIGERSIRKTPSYDRVIGFRNLLQKVSGKKQNVLTRQKQAELADALNMDMYEMMKVLWEASLEVHNEYINALERLQESRVPLASGVESIRGEARIGPDTNAGDAAVGIAVATHLGLKVSESCPTLLGSMKGAAALFALSNGEDTLRNLDRCGLLEQLLPELTDCRTLMPRDNVHVYSVFEHTMQVIRKLDQVEPGTFLGDLKDSLSSLEPLYLAALLHDVGKRNPKKRHSEAGAEIAEDVCNRWSLSPGFSELVVWLVREHLAMARFIRIRDVADPRTVQEFAQLVGNSERLIALTLLTWADINAVSEDAWTPTQEVFLKQLFYQTSELIDSDKDAPPDATQYRKRVMKQLKEEDVPEGEIKEFVDSLPPHYLANANQDLVRLHFQFAQAARHGEPTVDLFHQPHLGTTEVTICSADAPTLLNRVLGVLYAHDLSLVGIRACTTETDYPVALDVFTVSFGGRAIPAATCKALSKSMEGVLAGEIDVNDLLRSKGKDPERQQVFYTYAFSEGNPAVLEFRAPRGRGVAYRLSKLISDKGWNIMMARVGQWAGNAAAAFYVTHMDGSVITAEEVETALGMQLSESI